MKECQECNGVKITCTRSGTMVYEGQEAYHEELKCDNCGVEGEIIEYMDSDQIIYIGKIKDV